MSENLVASGYDAVYAALPGSPTFHRIWSTLACGADYPAGFGHISFLTLGELRELTERLELCGGGLLVDLACGAGGPGLWVASMTKSRLIGIDLSGAGLLQARRRATVMHTPATFVRATLSAVALQRGQADAAMSVDAIQYVPDKQAAVAEVARVLRSGARLVFTAFELEPDHVSDLPVLGDDPVSDYRPLLEGSGFVVESYEETPRWQERVVATYEAVLAAADILGQELGAEAFAALAFEMMLTLERDPYRRRVLAVARRV
ncbi:MAG: methyltransferase domain-containing protein [Chloroflexi bacterium]|nr:MAG: methyltransferase domain-containing protein [Chloroflexota bacterium]